MTITFDSVVDDLIDWLGAHSGHRVVGSKPADGQEYVLLTLAGGARTTRVTAEIDVLMEVWVPRTAATADVDAEQIAERIRTMVDGLQQSPAGNLRRYRVSWPQFPTNLPPADELDQAAWARVVMRAAINVRGRPVGGAAEQDHAVSV